MVRRIHRRFLESYHHRRALVNMVVVVVVVFRSSMRRLTQGHLNAIMYLQILDYRLFRSNIGLIGLPI
jgi:hypothetical protein